MRELANSDADITGMGVEAAEAAVTAVAGWPVVGGHLLESTLLKAVECSSCWVNCSHKNPTC